MTVTSYRSAEPLYIISMRNNPQAESLFRTWIRQNRIEHAVVQNNRLMLHDQQSFEQFRITWTVSLDSVAIWNTWTRRHVYLE